MKKIKEYAGWISTLIMVIVWIATVFLYGKKIDSNTESINEMNGYWMEQLELNGQIIMYMKMDKHE